MKITKGQRTDIHSYKHNEIIHRVWRNTLIIENSNNLLVTAHKKRVFEQSGRSWFTKEPAVCYFYKDLWFNIIVMFKRLNLLLL